MRAVLFCTYNARRVAAIPVCYASVQTRFSHDVSRRAAVFSGGASPSSHTAPLPFIEIPAVAYNVA